MIPGELIVCHGRDLTLNFSSEKNMQINDEECRLCSGLYSLVIEFDQICLNHCEVPGPIFSKGLCAGPKWCSVGWHGAKPLTLKTVCNPPNQAIKDIVWGGAQIEVMNNRLNDPGVSLWPSLNSCFFSQFPHDILSQRAQKFDLLCGNSPLVGSHFEKENLKGSHDHMIPLWGRNAG